MSTQVEAQPQLPITEMGKISTLKQATQSAKEWLVEIGRVAVDSGQIMIVDPCRKTVDADHVFREEHDGVEPEEFWRQYHKWTATQQEEWNQKHPFNDFLQINDKDGSDSTFGPQAPLAVISSTGIGDGIYPVYARIIDLGEWGKRVASLTIDFGIADLNATAPEHEEAA